MALETGTFISDLVPTNPVGSDPLAFADDHLRLVKSTIKNSFPNISGAVTKTHSQINTAVDQAGTAVQPAAMDAAIATAVSAAVAAAKEALHPVGSIYINAGVATNPATLLGFGTWVAFGAGRVMVGLNGSDTQFDALEETGGSNTSGSSTPSMTASSTSIAVPRDGWGTEGAALGVATSGRLLVGSGSGEIAEVLESVKAAGTDRDLGTHTHTISGGAHTHSVPTPPYITVAMWKRTA